MNFGIWGFTIFFPTRESSFLKASTSERGEGGDIPPPGAAMAAAVELAEEDLAQQRSPRTFDAAIGSIIPLIVLIISDLFVTWH